MRQPAVRLLRHLGIAALLSVTLGSGTLVSFAQAGIGVSVAHAIGLQGHGGGGPNHVDPGSGATSVLHQPPQRTLPSSAPRSARPAMPHVPVPSMRPGTVTLDPATTSKFVGSDGRLEVDVPAGAVSTDDAAAAGGKVALKITEIAPPSGAEAGGSGLISLGMYEVVVVDGKGHAVGHGLRQPAVLKLHYGSKDRVVDLDGAFVVFNGARPSGVGPVGPYSVQKVTRDAANQVLQVSLPADAGLIQATASATPTPAATGTPAARPTATTTPAARSTPTASLNAKPTAGPTTTPGATPTPSGTPRATPSASPSGGAKPKAAAGNPLSYKLPTAFQVPLTTFSWDTYPPVAKFGSPDPLNVDLNAGSLTEGLAIDVPPGPAGAMPNITLAYNSAAVSEQHSPQGAAGWVGEGWSMGLGEITWAEHDQYPTCTTCGNTWQSTWELTDPFGTSTELIPPNTTTSTYYDDSPNWWCTTGNASATSCPIQFQTARETHAKVYAYVGPNALGAAPDNPPCFRVYLTNGVMEEFGCTPDSLQYFPIQAHSLANQRYADLYYPVAWLLDLITNPQGDQVHVTYQSDTETAPDGLTYPRDVVMSTIEWDAPDCVGASQGCGSATWHPHYRVQFSATHQQAQILRTTTSGTCNGDANQRCDDPAAVGGIAPPLVNSTFALNDIDVQTNMSGNGSNYNGATWSTVRDYRLSYEQSGPTTLLHDPATGMSVSTAGYLDLTQIQEVGDDGTTTYPATTFGYTTQTEYYEDGSFQPYTTTFCGPSWNQGGNGDTCALWSQSYDGNSRYLASVSNGQGLLQTFSWAEARNNTHGVNGGVGIDNANPLYCDSHQSGYPCDEADDQDWSRAVVTQRADSVVRLTQSGQGGQQTSTTVTSTYGYTYQLSYPLAAQECGDCVAGMYWGNELDGDYLDYYHGTFMGFAQAAVSNPDGSVVVHKYEPTQGWGVYDTNQGLNCGTSTLPPVTTTCEAAPWWNVANAGHGLETETDSYDTNGTTLLKQVTAQYRAVCPPVGVGSSPPTGYGTWDGQLVGEEDPENPVADCEVQQTQQITSASDGGTSGVTDTEAYKYDGDVVPGGDGACPSGWTCADVGNPPLAGGQSDRGGGSWTLSSEGYGIWAGPDQFHWMYRPQTGNGSTSVRVVGQTNTNTYGSTGVILRDGTDANANYYYVQTEPQRGLYFVYYRTSPGTAPQVIAQGNATLPIYLQATRTGNTFSASTSSDGANWTPIAGSSVTLSFPTTVYAGVAVVPVSAAALSTATVDSISPSAPSGGSPYGRLTQTTSTANSGGGSGSSASPTSIVKKTTYVWNDGVLVPSLQRNNTSQEGAWGGTYLMDAVASSDTEDGGGTQYTCQRTNFDGQAYATGQTSSLSGADPTEQDQYATACGANPSGTLSSTTTYDNLGNATFTKDADANSGDGSHLAIGGACATATTCTQYGATTQASPTLSGNAQNQQATSAYAADASGGYGLWLTSSTDANGQTTTYGYDALGRETSMRSPGQGSGPATTSTAYANWCAGASAQTPCVEEDTTQRLDSATTVTTRQFYDGQGRLVETRTPAPGGQDVVQFTLYNAAGQAFASSVSYFVAAYAGGAGAAAYSIPDSTQSATSTTYDGLGRTLSVTDPLSEVSQVAYGVVCGAAGTGGDGGCYEQTLATDANGHRSGTLSDGFGRHIYAQSYTGNSTATYALYSTTKNTYDYNGRQIQTLHSDGTSKTTYTYDTAGRLTASSDPDQGAMTYGYDANGNLVQQTDARGASGTTYTGYDGLDRPVWRSTSNSPNGAYVTYAYDSTANGSYGTGRLAAEIFSGANGMSGAYTYAYDALGRTTRKDQTMGGVNGCPAGWSCADVSLNPPSLAGGQSYAGDNIWSINGSSGDLGGGGDQFHFIYHTAVGNGSASVQVVGQTRTDQYDKAGPMLRMSATDYLSAFYAAFLCPDGNVYVEDRATNGTFTIQTSMHATAPVYLKVARSGDTFTAYTSADGASWTSIPGSSVTLSGFGTTLAAGMAVTSRYTGIYSTATVANLTTTGGGGVCPTGWTCADVGNPPLAGDQGDLGGGSWMLSAAGNGIWTAPDQFRWMYRSQTGDGSISARVVSQTNTNTYGSTGVIFRDGTDANAPYYFVQAEQARGLYFVYYRATSGGAPQVVAQGNATFPIYLQATRTGNTFSASTSSDGVNWTPIAGSSVTLSFSTTLSAGVAISPSYSPALGTAIVDSITPNAPSPGPVTHTAGAPTGATSYPVQAAYDDGGLPLTTTYPDGEVVSSNYTPQGWLSGLSTTQNGTTTTLLSNASYTGPGGAAQQMTGASLANGVYSYGATFDALARATQTGLTRVSDGTVLYNQTRSFDAVGNVTGLTTTLPTGTDAQAFCYDELNRLKWASSASGSVPCGGTLTAGTLTAAQYTAAYNYDNLNRLTGGPQGLYSYGDPAHLDAATAIGATYTAKYDAAGNMTCRAPAATATCAGTPTGAQLTYDNEGRLTAWQNAPSAPSSTTANLYDGEGNRVEQQVTSGGVGSTITYVGQVEEVAVTGGSALTTTSYYARGKRIAEAVNGVFSYLGSDGLGSAQVALDANGNAQASILYDPYGNVRYSNGAMPTDYGFTGQHADGATGLDYYNARYYDPVAGQFTSADTVNAGGLNRYAYVGGNPETATDPTGHIRCLGDGPGGCGGGGSAPPITTTPTGTPTSTPTTTPTPRPGSSSQGTQSSSGGLGPGQAFGQTFEYTLSGLGFMQAVAKADVDAAVSYVAGVLATLLEHNHWAKDIGRYLRRVADADTADRALEQLKWLGHVLILANFITDWVLSGHAFYVGATSYLRPDLRGVERLAAAVWYGFVHSFISTLVTIGGGMAVGAAIPGIGAAIGGVLGTLAGGWIADQVTPHIIDNLYPGSSAPAKA